MEGVGISNGHLVYSTSICYSFWPFGGIHIVGHLGIPMFHVLVCCTKKNLATMPLCDAYLPHM
jgi:hypothetical protein